MKITGILGTTYLCSKFVNHDGTLVSDHPLYLFSTDIEGIALAVMFTSKTNPFTTHWKDGKDLKFICCSDHEGEFPTNKVFQSEVYIVNMADKNLKYSEYTFKNFLYHSDLLKALRNALREGLNTEYAFGIQSVHPYDNKEDVETKKEIMTELFNYVDAVITSCSYPRHCPQYGPVNTTYSEFKKFSNESTVKSANRKIFSNRYNN